MVTTAAQAAGIVPMAFVGRTSTDNMQDPVESLSRQLRVAGQRLPEGFAITRYYWDVESGAPWTGSSPGCCRTTGRRCSPRWRTRPATPAPYNSW